MPLMRLAMTCRVPRHSYSFQSYYFQAFLESVHRRPDMLAVLMGVSFDHRKGLVSRDSLDRRQIHPGLDKVRYGSVSKRVDKNVLRIKPCSSDSPLKWLLYIHGMPACCRDRGEEPGRVGRAGINTVLEKIHQVSSNGLLSCTGLCLWDVDDPAGKIDVLLPDGHDLHPTHRGLQSDDNEGVDLLVPVFFRDFNQSFHLYRREVGDASLSFLEAVDSCWPAIDPPPFLSLCEEVGEGGQFTVDCSRSCTFTKTVFLVPLKVKAACFSQSLLSQEWAKVESEPLFLHSEVFAAFLGELM